MSFQRILLWALLLTPARSQREAFTVPPAFAVAGVFTDNELYGIGDVLDIKWTTDRDQYEVHLWQQSLTEGAAVAGDTVFVKTSDDIETGGFSWLVDPQAFQLGKSNVFYMALGSNITIQGAMLTHYFNLTDAKNIPRPTTTSTIVAALQTSAGPSTTGTSTVSATTTDTTATSSPGASTILQPPAAVSSTSIALSMGLGLGLGLPIILLLAFIAYKLSRRGSGTVRRAHSRAPSRLYQYQQPRQVPEYEQLADEKHGARGTGGRGMHRKAETVSSVTSLGSAFVEMPTHEL